MDIQFLRDNNLIIFEAIAGSHAHGTNTPTSDTDIRGVFVLPKKMYYSLHPYTYEKLVKDKKGDVSFLELNAFLDFAYQNNPDVIELLFSPEDCVLFKDDVWDYIDPNKFLNKKAGVSFSGFARNQIRKAQGLKKAINNPQPKKRKSPLHFCKIIEGVKSKDLLSYYSVEDLKNAGVSNVQNGEGVYGLFLDPANKFNFKGLINKDETSNGLRLSSIPKEWYSYYKQEPIIIVYNQNGYKVHCKDHKKYWDWVANRNENRYKKNIEHGKNYDSKNMSHTMRGATMGLEIIKGEGVKVRRTEDREKLLKIKNGDEELNVILEEVEKIIEQIRELTPTSPLPDEADIEYINNIAYKIRNDFYAKKCKI